ncbi:MAG: hypothetical protein ABFR36_02415 [Acidobacteriota bacterium]
MPSKREKRGSKIPEKIGDKAKIIFFSTLFLLFVLIVIGYFILLDNKSSFADSRIDQMSSLVKKVRTLEDSIQANQNDILNLVGEYRNKTGKNLPILDVINLSEEERLLLEEKISTESNISIKNLLAEILAKKSEILELNMHIKSIEKFLPKPHVVTEGENHYQVAMDYLLNIKGIEKNEALELVERTFLFEPLIPGFKLWNFYSNGEFGSFISQGNASISPNTVSRREKRKLTDARDSAIEERDSMAEDIKTLRSKRDNILLQISSLNNEKKHLLKRIEELNLENSAIVRTVNSLHYIIDTKKNLVRGGVLRGGFLKSLKLQSISPELYTNSVDLRSEKDITFNSDNLNLKKIRRIRVFPKFYKTNIDYKVKFMENKKFAQLKILNSDKLKNERIVIAVE